MLKNRRIALLLGSMLSFTPVADAFAQQIILDGRTNTTLSAINPTTTTITTTTFSGGNGINAFKSFDVYAGNIVNLIQPSNTNALINIVTGPNATNISGVLNAFKDGRIGGNSIIANTNGIVIGKDGAINAGRLTLTTPSSDFSNSLFGTNGSINGAALEALSAGSEPLSPTGDVGVFGKIEAEAVAIRAGRDIKVDGVIYSRFGDITYAVDGANGSGGKSTKAQAATGLSVDSNGVVRLFAGRDISVKGKIVAKRQAPSTSSSSQNVSGGETYLYAAQNLTLEQEALIDVSGTGQGNAGTALLFGQNNAYSKLGSSVEANAEAGNGGFVEFSAGKTVQVAGNLSAYSQTGLGGTIFIDPEDLVISTNQTSNGANLIFIADKTIAIVDGVTINTDGGDLTLAVGEDLKVDNATVDATGRASSATAILRRDAKGVVVLDKFGKSITIGANVIISTRDLAVGDTNYASGTSVGNSGAVTIFAPDIYLKNGSKVYAQADAGKAAGTVTLEAKSDELKGFGFLTNPFGITSIKLENAAIQAGTINLISEAYATNLDKRREPDGDNTSSVGGAIPDWPDLPELPSIPSLVADYFTIEARAKIDVTGSTLLASQGIKIDSTAITDVEDQTNFYVGAGFNMGISKTTSTIRISNSKLTANQDIAVKSNAKEYQNFAGKLYSTDRAPTIFVSISDRDVKNQVLIDTASELTATRNIDVSALTTKSLRQQNNIANGTGGKVQASFVYSDGDNLTEVVVGGKLNAQGKIDVKASTTVEQYIITSAVGGLVSTGFAYLAGRSKSAAPANGMLSENGNKVFNEDLSGELAKSNAIAVSVVRNIEDDKTIARIGTTYTDLITGAQTSFVAAGAPSLTAVGNINVSAEHIIGVDRGVGGAFAQGQPVRVGSSASINASSDAKNALVVGSAWSNFNSQVLAEIGSTAELISTGSGAINVTAKSQALKFRFDLTSFDDEWDRFFEELDGTIGSDSKVTSGSKAAVTLEIPDFPYDPRNFTTVQSGSSSSAEKIGAAFNGHVFDVDNDVSAIVRGGAKLNTTGDVLVEASNRQQSVNLANYPLPFTFALAAGVGNGIGGSVNAVIRKSKVQALIENGVELDGRNITIRAKNEGVNLSSANSFGKAEKTSVNGALSTNIVDNDTIAQIGETAKVTASEKLSVVATDDLDLWSVATGWASGGQLGVGIANANNLISRSTQALIGSNVLTAPTAGSKTTTYIQAKAVDVLAENSGLSIAVSVAGGQAAKGYSGAASVGLQKFDKVEAVAGINVAGKMAIGTGGLKVFAKNAATVIVPTGSIGTSLSGSLSGAASTFVANNLDTRVFIKDATILSDGDINVTAEQDIDVVLVAIGGAISSGNAGTGSATVNTIDGTIAADVIAASLTTTGAANIKISGTDTSHINGFSGALASGSSSAFGASVSYNTIELEQRAGATGSVLDAAAIDIITKADARIRAVAATATVGGSFTGNGAVTFNDIGNVYRTYLQGGTIIARTNGISVLTEKASEIQSLAGGISGSGSGSLGGAVAVNFIHDEILAEIDVSQSLNATGALIIDTKNTSTVRSIAIAGAGSAGAAGTASVAFTQIGSKLAGDSDLADGEYGDEQRDAIMGVVNAENQLGADLNNGTDTNRALLNLQNNVSVTPEVTAKYVDVKASDTSTIETLAGSTALSATTGIGAGLALNSYFGRTDAAVVTKGTTRIVTTDPTQSLGLAIQAKNAATISTAAGALAGGVTFGGAGSATINLLNGGSYAGILGFAGTPSNKITLSGGDIIIEAAQTGTIESLAGAVGAGGTAGVAGAVSVNLLSSNAQADISNLNIDANDGFGVDRKIDVDASLKSKVTTIAGSAGAAGTAAFAGSVSVNRFDGLVIAKLDNATLTTNGAITFDAKLEAELDAITAGAAAAGVAAIGASVSINDIGGVVQALALNSTQTGSSVSFDALADADMTTIGGAAAAAGLASANAAQSENNLKTQVKAQSLGGAISSTGGVNFTARNTGINDSTLISLSFSKGVAAGASIASAKNEAIIVADMSGTNVTASNRISVGAFDTSTITAKGIAVAGAIGLGASGVVTDAKNSAQVLASINGTSNLTSSGAVNVEAVTNTDLRTDQAVAAGGVIGAGVAVSTSTNDTKVQANVGGTGTINAASVLVKASDEAGVEASALAVAAGVGGGAGTIISSTNIADVDSSIDSGRTIIASGNVEVAAKTDSTILAKQLSTVVAFVGAGTSVARADNNANTNANIGATAVNANNIKVAATDLVNIDATGFAIAAGAVAGSAADIDALNGSTITSGVSAGSKLTARGTLNVNSTATGTVDANTAQVNVGGVVLGLSQATAKSNIVMSTLIADAAQLVANGAINIGSNINLTVGADAFSVSGGALGIGGSRADANDDYLANTIIGNAKIQSNASSLTIGTNATTTSRANATGVAIGVVASGSVKAFSGQDGSTTIAKTTIGAGADLAAGGTLDINATATKTQTASAISGAGGVGSFTSGEANTRALSDVGVVVNASIVADKTKTMSDYLRITSALNVLHTAKTNNVNASIIGYSGGKTNNQTVGFSQIIIGENAQLAARHVDIKAKNDVRQNDVGDNVLSKSGGAFDGAAASATTTINNITNVLVKDGVVIEQYYAPNSFGGLNLGIENSIYGRLTTTLDSGGAIAVANSTANFNATQVNNVEIGNAKLFAAGNLRLYNSSNADIDVKARSTTYGASGSAQASSNANFASNDNIILKTGADVEGVKGVNIAVGNSAAGDASIRVAADTRLYNRTLIPVSTKPAADASVNATRRIDIQNGAFVSSANDVSISATKAKNSVSEYGLGKDLWQEIFEELFGGILDLFFGIDLSLEVRSDVNPIDASSSSLNIAGSVLAGNRSEQYLIIDGNGDVVAQGSDRSAIATTEGISFTLRRNVALIGEAQARIDALDEDILRVSANNTNGAFDGELIGLQAERDLRINQRNALLASGDPTGTYLDLNDIFVDEGNIIINSANITAGPTGSLQANGKAILEIDVAANMFINTGNIIFDREDGGRISINNVSVTNAGEMSALSSVSAAAGFDVTVPTAKANSISKLNINSSYSSPTDYGPDIVLNGKIDNKRGEITLRTERGTIDSRAEITALVFSATAPKGGFIQTYTAGVTNFGNPEAHYADSIRDYEARRAAAGLPTGMDASGNFSLYDFDLTTGAPKRDILGNLVLDNVRWVNRNYSEFSNPINTSAISSIRAGKEVFISAEYVNLNGLIQSGGGLFDLNISNQITQARLDAYFATSLPTNVGREVIYTTNPSPTVTNIAGITGNVIVFYDHELGRLVADETTTTPGRITIVGDIISTGRGKLQAFDGFGQINVTNASNFDLELSAMSTGTGVNGVEGLINITDTGQQRVNVSADLPRGEFLRTTYRYLYGQTEISDNDLANDTITIVGAKQSIYQPTLNRQYVYDTARDVTIKNTIIFNEHNDILTADSMVSNIANYSAGAYTQNGRVRIETRSGPITYVYDPFSNGIGLKTIDLESKGFDPITTKAIFTGVPYTRTVSGTQVTYVGTSVRQQFLSHAFKADYPVITEFVGATSPGINVNSTGSGRVLFAESVSNVGPTTLSAQASILSLSDQVHVGSGSATITALGSISGTGNSPLNFEFADNAILNITARDNINIRQFANSLNADGDLIIAKAHHTGDLGFDANTLSGNVTIRATGSITGTGSQASQVRGINVNLASDDGSIDAGTAPLRIATGQGLDAHFNASATKDINISQASGDLKVDLIESRTGNVRIDVGSGQVLDANLREVADTQTISALTKVWEDLGLLDDGTGNVEARLIGERNAQYAQYWDKRRTDPSAQTFALTNAERVAFFTPSERAELVGRGLTQGQIDSRIDAFVSDMQGLYDIWNGQAAYDPAYSYSLRGTELADSRAEWQLTQLQFGIPNTLDLDATDTTTAIEDPNIKAQGSITIIRSGGIGTFTPDHEILAGSGDLFDTTRRTGETQKQADKRVQDVYLSLLTAEEGDVRRAGDKLFVRRANDIDVTATGNILLNAQAAGGSSGNIFLGSEKDLALERLTAAGEVRVTTSGDIIDMAPDTLGTVVAGGAIILESAKGFVGSATRAFWVRTNNFVTARAAKDIFIASNDNLNVGRINADNLVTLSSRLGGIFDWYADAKANVRGVGFDLKAAADIGTAANPLEIIQDAGTGALRLTAQNAYLVSEKDLRVERWNVGAGIAQLELVAGSLEFAPKNGEPGLSTGAAIISVPGSITDDTSNNLAIDVADLKLIAGGIGSLSPTGVENRLNINTDIATLSASRANAIFRIDELDGARFGTLGLPILREIHLGTGGDLALDVLEASHVINLNHIAGNLLSGTIKSDYVSIDTAGDIGSVAPVDITANRLDLAAKTVDLDITVAAPTSPLSLTLRGGGGKAAEQINVRVTTTGAVEIKQLLTARGDISTTGNRLTLLDGVISENVWFRQAGTDLYVTNKGKFVGLSGLADIQAITNADGSLNFNLRNQTELAFAPHILHHRQPFLTVDGVEDFASTAYEIVSTRPNDNHSVGRAVQISIVGSDGMVLGGFVLRFQSAPGNEIDPEEFIQGEEFQAYVRSIFGESAVVRIAMNDNQGSDFSLTYQ